MIADTLSFALLHRMRRLASRVLPWVMVALLATGLAHASHLHKPGNVGHTDALHCGLCLQFDRLAAAPSTPPALPAAPIVSWAPLPQSVAPASDPFVSLYDARGPPRH